MFKKCIAFICFLTVNNITIASSNNTWQPHAFQSKYTRKEPCTVCGSMQAENIGFSEGQYCSQECMFSLKKELFNPEDIQSDIQVDWPVKPFTQEWWKEYEAKKQAAEAEGQPVDKHVVFQMVVFGGKNTYRSDSRANPWATK